VREEISSGGVVVFRNAILLLRKYNGDWVLPKGKVEKKEKIIDTAVREVFEEGGVRAEVIQYLGKIHYAFKNGWQEHELVNKTVHWYLMKARSMDCIPLKDEGFVEARFVHIRRATELAKYDDERDIIEKAIREMQKDLNLA